MSATPTVRRRRPTRSLRRPTVPPDCDRSEATRGWRHLGKPADTVPAPAHTPGTYRRHNHAVPDACAVDVTALGLLMTAVALVEVQPGGRLGCASCRPGTNRQHGVCVIREEALL